MLDIKRIRQNPQALESAMRARGNKGADVSGLLELDRRRRAMMQEAEALKARRNEVSAQIPRMKGEGGRFGPDGPDEGNGSQDKGI